MLSIREDFVSVGSKVSEQKYPEEIKSISKDAKLDLDLHKEIYLRDLDELPLREQKLSAMHMSEFKEGDILLYLPNKKHISCAQKAISFFQWLTKRKNGHYEIAHAAIFEGYHEEKGALVPKIVDVTGAGYSIRKLKDDQPLLVFRPYQPAIGKEIAEVARSIKNKPSKPYWSCCLGLETFFKRTKLVPKHKLPIAEKDVPNATICSQFVIKTIKKAMIESKLPEEIRLGYYLNINSKSTPKDLEAELYENKNYRMLCYVGKENPFALIKTEIEAQLIRLKNRSGHAAKNKYRACAMKFHSIINHDLRTESYDNLQKAILLTKLMLESFSVNAGRNFKTPTSYTSLLNFARRIGIFRRDINGFEYKKLSEIEMESCAIKN